MSGILTLDKGIVFLLIVAVNIHPITHKLVYTRLQTTTTSASSWTVFWAWRSTSRMLCSSISLTRWQPSYKKQRGTADTIWGFLVRQVFCVAFMVNRRWDGNNLLPAVDLGSGDEKVKKVDCRKFLTPGYTTSGHVELHTVCLRIIFGYYGCMFLVSCSNNKRVFICLFFWQGECGERNVLGGGNARLGRSKWSRWWLLCSGMAKKLFISETSLNF